MPLTCMFMYFFIFFKNFFSCCSHSVKSRKRKAQTQAVAPVTVPVAGSHTPVAEEDFPCGVCGKVDDHDHDPGIVCDGCSAGVFLSLAVCDCFIIILSSRFVLFLSLAFNACFIIIFPHSYDIFLSCCLVCLCNQCLLCSEYLSFLFCFPLSKFSSPLCLSTRLPSCLCEAVLS